MKFSAILHYTYPLITVVRLYMYMHNIIIIIIRCGVGRTCTRHKSSQSANSLFAEHV